MRRLPLSLVVACTVSALAGPLRAGETGSNAPATRWVVGLAGGEARNHGRSEGAPWFEVRVGRALAGGALSLDLGLAASGVGSASHGPAFGTATLGLEGLPLPRHTVSPFARVELGLLAEDEYGGTLASIGGGVAVRVGPRLSLRVGLSIGNHDGQNGPNSYYGGVQYRW